MQVDASVLSPVWRYGKLTNDAIQSLRSAREGVWPELLELDPVPAYAAARKAAESPRFDPLIRAIFEAYDLTRQHNEIIRARISSGQVAASPWEFWEAIVELLAAVHATHRELQSLLHQLKAVNFKLPNFLGIEIDSDDRRAFCNGKCAEFGSKILAWKLFLCLFDAREFGASRSDLVSELWPGEARTDNALNQHKSTVEGLLLPLGLTIDADGRGIWSIRAI